MKFAGGLLASAARPYFLLALIIALSCAASAQSTTSKIVITEEQANQTIAVHTGEVVTIKLAIQSGTGYSWQFTSDHSDVAALEGEPEILSDGNTIPGGVKAQLFHVHILLRGTAHLEMRYVRPWEKDASPQKTFKLTIHAHGKKIRAV